MRGLLCELRLAPLDYLIRGAVRLGFRGLLFGRTPPPKGKNLLKHMKKTVLNCDYDHERYIFNGIMNDNSIMKELKKNIHLDMVKNIR